MKVQRYTQTWRQTGGAILNDVHDRALIFTVASERTLLFLCFWKWTVPQVLRKSPRWTVINSLQNAVLLWLAYLTAPELLEFTQNPANRWTWSHIWTIKALILSACPTPAIFRFPLIISHKTRLSNGVTAHRFTAECRIAHTSCSPLPGCTEAPLATNKSVRVVYFLCFCRSCEPCWCGATGPEGPLAPQVPGIACAVNINNLTHSD